MKQLFLPYELALLAKEKGFNEECFGNYAPHLLLWDYGITNSKLKILANSVKTETCAAPLYQQIIDWLREAHNIHINLYPSFDNEENCKEITGYSGHLWWEFKDHRSPKSKEIPENYSTKCKGEIPKTYYEALNKAIEEAFKLI
jgi:hypothetical protein